MPYLLLSLAALFWSGNFVLGRGLHEVAPPFTLASWRWLAAALILAPFALRVLWRQRDLVRRHLGELALLGALGASGYSALVYVGLQHTGTINAVLITSLTPVLIALFAWLLDGDRITRRQALGIAVSLSGAAWIVTGGHPGRLADLGSSRGELWILTAAACWAIYSVRLRHLPPGLDSRTFLMMVALTGWLVLLPFHLYEAAHGQTLAPTTGNLLAVGYLALFASLLAFVCWNSGIRRIGAARGGVFMQLMPVFGTGLAMLFLGERFAPYHALGIGLIATGLYLTLRSPATR